MQSVNLANSPRDALLLAFKDAKLSVVEYDPESHDLKTLSLHYFEEDDMKVLNLLQRLIKHFIIILGWLDAPLSCPDGTS